MFLYPNSGQFPFDAVCEQIVSELEKRNWQVPGLTVEFDTYGHDYQMVRHIKSQDFTLWFSRKQRHIPGGDWNDTAAISRIVIPRKIINVYDDESGPSFYLYVGNNYERDRERFMHGLMVNSKLNREPRMYLTYKGGCNCGNNSGATFGATEFITTVLLGDKTALKRLYHQHRHRRSPLLVHSNDLGREYDPKGDEPVLFRTDEVMAEFKEYLETVVLGQILSQPVPEVTA